MASGYCTGQFRKWKLPITAGSSIGDQAPAGPEALRRLVMSPIAAWSSAWGSPATFGPVFEEQPLGLLFPEESTEEKVTLACRARASPPATYR